MTKLEIVQHHVSCGCCGDLLGRKLDRRQLVHAAATGVAALALAPYLALAAEGEYEAMVLACIDPRMQ
jgi:hypothetical protein